MIVKLTYEPCCVVQPFFLGPDVKKARFHSPPSSAEDKVKRFFYPGQITINLDLREQQSLKTP